MRNLFLGLAVLAILSNVVILVMIMASLDRRGHKTNILLSRLYTFKYLSAYRNVTRKETGKPGPLSDLWIFTVILAVVAALIGFHCP